MARNQSPFSQWAQYLPLRAISVMANILPMQLNMQAGKHIGQLFFNLDKRHRNRALKNISWSFPELNKEEVWSLAKKSTEHMFQLFTAEAIKMPSLVTPTTWERYIQFKDVDRITKRLAKKEPILFITGHCGNWELLGYSLSLLGYPIAALARPLDNPLINSWVLKIRQKHGLNVITKWGGVPILQELLSKNTSIGFIADQNAGEKGMFVPFFGRMASTYKSIGLLAMRHQIPIAAVHAKRINKQFKYEISMTDFIEPKEWEQHEDPLYYITARYNHAIENMIKSAPEQYLWLHRRWKSRPPHERKGEAMPKKMIKQLESLPWLTAKELKQLIER